MMRIQSNGKLRRSEAEWQQSLRQYRLRVSLIVNTQIGDREHRGQRAGGVAGSGIVNAEIGVVNTSIGHREHRDRSS